MITEANRNAYLATGWLLGEAVSSISDLEFPTVDTTTIVCFESHLIARLGLPPSKFLVSILNFLKCELIHLNLNTIIALSCFTMLCECWLGISPDTSLFWYFYYLARYDKHIFSRIGLSMLRHRRNEYLNATFKGYWKGASQKWFLVDMHTDPQQTNKHLLPSHIDDKRTEPELTSHLTTLVKRVTEHRQVRVRACHRAEEFTL
jgi:hypothetical protein